MGAIVAAADGMPEFIATEASPMLTTGVVLFFSRSLVTEWFHYLKEGLSGTRRAHGNDCAERVKETVHGAGVVKGSYHSSSSFLSLSARS
jgi:hypothetical protein